jgi:hypothetical protein
MMVAKGMSLVTTFLAQARGQPTSCNNSSMIQPLALWEVALVTLQ